MSDKNKKLISALLIILTMLPAVLFSFPQKTGAQAGSVPINTTLDKNSTTNATANEKSWLQKTYELLKMAIAKKALEKITQSVVNWINSDFHGSPLFLENPQSFFKDIVKSEVRKYVDLFGYDLRKYPFGKDFALNTIAAYKNTLANNAAYSLSRTNMTQQEIANYMQLENGGWNSLYLQTQFPQNNYIGFQLLANDAIAGQLNGTVEAPAEKYKSLLQQGQGFLSPQKCMDDGTKYNNGYNEFNRPSFNASAVPWTCSVPGCTLQNSGSGGNPACDACNTTYENAVSAAYDKWAETNTCKNLVNTTPGSVVADQIMTHLSSNVRQNELSMALGNSLSAIFDTLINHFLEKGLNSLSGNPNRQPPADNWTYDGNTLDGTSVPRDPGALIIPQNVSVHTGETTSTTISGGTAPYDIKTPPDTRIATAAISGNRLTVTGVVSGETTVVINDSSFPEKTASVRITIVGNGGLMAIPANIVINTTDTASVNISGGTEPYSMFLSPNSAVATGLFSDNILVVNGNAPGQTSAIIKDSSSTPKMVTIGIKILAPAENPSVILTANPTNIQAGQSSTLSWSSQNATSCLSSWTFGNMPTSGSTVVFPRNTTSYSISCSNDSGQSASSSVTVNVI